ncbi:MAG: hypothetical protein ACK4GR_02600 [bacterium]
MILYLIDSKISIDVSDFKELDLKPTKIYVIKIRKNYFWGFVLKKYPYLNKKVIKIRNLNIVDSLDLKSFEEVFKSFELIIEEIGKFKDFLARYFYSGFEKFIKTFINYENILKVWIKDIIAQENFYDVFNKIKKGKDIEVKYIEHDYLENKTYLIFKITKFKSEKIKGFLKELRKNLRKRISFSLDYHISVKENYFLKFFGDLELIYDLERVYKKVKKLDFHFSGVNFWKDNEIVFLNSRKFVFPLWAIVFHKFFDKVKIDYFPYFSYFFSFFVKLVSKIDFNSNLSLLNAEVKEEIIEVFKLAKSKIVFENFSIRNIVNLFNKDNPILFYSFYKSFYKIYCRYCKNVPYCEICSDSLKIYPRSIKKNEKIEDVKLFCPKCKIKYDLFNCQYCGKFDWYIWKKDYKEILSGLDVSFINFLPSNFSYYLGNTWVDNSREYVVVIDYFSLNKPFILKELNIWYVLEKLVNQVPLRSIVFINCEEFDIFEYFSQFFEDEKILIKRLEELLILERKLISKVKI